MAKFWTFGSYIGKKRELVDLKGMRDLYQVALDNKIRDWKIAPERITELNKQIAKLEQEID